MSTTCRPPDPAATKAKLLDTATPLAVPKAHDGAATVELTNVGFVGSLMLAIRNPDDPAAMNARLPAIATSHAISGVASEPSSVGDSGLLTSMTSNPAAPAAR